MSGKVYIFSYLKIAHEPQQQQQTITVVTNATKKRHPITIPTMASDLLYTKLLTVITSLGRIVITAFKDVT
jgi:hypothetical protein